MVKIDIQDQVMDIEDMGVTLRTLLAVAATGYALTNKRRWGIRYKNAVIGNVQCASTPRTKTLKAGPVLAEPDQNAASGLDRNTVIGNVQVASIHRPGSLQASLMLVGLA
jgi:hypothetical protein